MSEDVVIPIELLKNPWRYICNYYESLYPCMGRKVFSIVSLIPPSLILPPIPNGRKKIKQKINLFLIANPSSGKTSIAEEFEKIATNPIFSESMTPAYLNFELRDKDKVTIITSDVAQSLINEEFVKLLEQILGDEGKISRNTMQDKTKRRKIEAVAYLSGTPSIISNDRIRDGLLFRCSPLIVTLSSDEHNFILDSVNNKMGIETQGNNIEHIISFYNLLNSIQEGTHDEINPIKGYIISEEIKQKLIDFIKPLVQPSFEEYGIHAVRQLQEAYRFMVSHAFLNIYNKQKEGKIKNNKLVIDDKDLEVAKYLIDIEIETIFHIIESLNDLKAGGIKTYKQLREWQNRKKLKDKKTQSRERKFIMEGIVK